MYKNLVRCGLRRNGNYIDVVLLGVIIVVELGVWFGEVCGKEF